MFKIPYPIKEMLTFLGDHNYKKQFYFFSVSTTKPSTNLKPLLMEDNWCIRCQDWKLGKITAGISPVIIKKIIFAWAQLFKMHHMTEYPPPKTGDIQGYTPGYTPRHIPQFWNLASNTENSAFHFHSRWESIVRLLQKKEHINLFIIILENNEKKPSDTISH